MLIPANMESCRGSTCRSSFQLLHGPSNGIIVGSKGPTFQLETVKSWTLTAIREQARFVRNHKRHASNVAQTSILIEQRYSQGKAFWASFFKNTKKNLCKVVHLPDCIEDRRPLLPKLFNADVPINRACHSFIN